MSLPTEFDRTGVTYYAVAPEGYVYSSEQTAQYSTRKYTTLEACEAAMPYSPTTPFVVNILGSWSVALGTSTWSGPTFTAVNYLIIRCINEARHNGVYSNTAARVSVTSGYGLRVYTAYTTIDGLQFVTGTPTAAIYMIGLYNSSSTVFDSCLVKGPGGTPGYYMWGIECGANGGTIKNCVIYDWRSSITNGVGIASDSSAVGNYYNNTIRNCDYGFYSYVSGGVATNNVVQDCASGCYYGTSAFTGSNNVADDSTAPGTAKITGEVAFEDEANGNFQLTTGDTVARGAGVALAAVDDDITGTARTRNSCGAFEGTESTSENAVTESEAPTRATESQSVTQPNAITSTENPARAIESATASQVVQANTVTSVESGDAPSESEAVAQPTVVASIDLPSRAAETSTAEQARTVASVELPLAPSESEAVLAGNTCASTESPVSPIETSSVTQPVAIVSTEAIGAPVEALMVLPGSTVASAESPATAGESGAATQQIAVSSTELSSVTIELATALVGNTVSGPESPYRASEVASASQPVAVVSIESPQVSTEASTVTQGTAVLSSELSAPPSTSGAVYQPVVVVSTEPTTAPVEHSSVVETWSVTALESVSAPSEIQTAEESAYRVDSNEGGDTTALEFSLTDQLTTIVVTQYESAGARELSTVIVSVASVPSRNVWHARPRMNQTTLRTRTREFVARPRKWMAYL